MEYREAVKAFSERHVGEFSASLQAIFGRNDEDDRNSKSKWPTLEQLRKQNDQFTKGVTPFSSATADTADSTIVLDETADDVARERVKVLRERLRLLRNMDPGLHEYLVSQGGHAKMVADIEAELQVACATLREAKPLSIQKASAESHLRKVVKQHEAAATQLSKLQEQHQEVIFRCASSLLFRCTFRWCLGGRGTILRWRCYHHSFFLG